MRKGLTTLNKYRNTNKMSPKITQNDSAEIIKKIIRINSVEKKFCGKIM